MNAPIIVLLISLIFSTTVPQTRPASEKDFSAAFDAQIRKTLATFPDLPGIAIVVIKDDRPIFVRAYGMADREVGIKADSDTLFYTGSSTKSFTALAAALLDQEGGIKLSDPVTKYTPGIHFKNEIPDKVTIQNLLTHTSGLRNSPLINRLAFTGEINQSELDHVFADGTTFNDANFGKYNYTNLGYNIYALALHYHLHKKWQDVLQERIFTPAGLKHTTAYVSKARARKFKIVAPYVISTEPPDAGKMVRSGLEKTDENMQSAGGIFMMIDHLIVAIRADLPAEPVFAISREWRLVPRALCVTCLRFADNIGRHDLFAVELTAVHVQVKPPAEVRNAHEDSTGRLHVLIGLFELASHHLACIDRIGVDDIRRRDPVLPGARL